MDKIIVVSINRDCWRFPKLTITVEARVRSRAAARKFITEKVMAAFEKRMRGKKGQFNSIRVKDYRIVDERGLKYLRAAAKASVTIRRKRVAQKAAKTRAKNRAARLARSAPPEPKKFFPVAGDYTYN